MRVANSPLSRNRNALPMNDIGWQVWTTIQQEFRDIPDVAELTRLCVRMLMAMLLGGLLGYERESHGKSAGLRTHMLVALGSAIFVLIPLQAGMQVADLSRVLQGIVAGIGFLGAGTIMKLRSDGEIHGLTTAASIWMASAVGIAAGMGRESTAVLATLLSLFTLAALKRFAHRKRNEADAQRAAQAPTGADKRNSGPMETDASED